MSATPNTQVAGTRATQGHRYHWRGLNVLAMESGTSYVRVRLIENMPEGHLWLGSAYRAPVANLVAQPMGYFKGEVPRG